MSSSAALPGMASERGGVRPWVLLLLFTILALVTVFRHEMWRDEIHAWQAVAAADSLSELADNVRTEGHPGLWFALLYPVTKFTGDPVAMQLLHVAIAVGVAAMVLFFSPFPLSWRGLVVLGYFPLYEYCAISRNYAVGALLLFLFCALFPSRHRRPLVAAATLALLAQASVYALILSFALGVVWIAEDRRPRGGMPRIGHGRAVLAFGMWLVGILISVVQLVQASPVKHPFDPEKVAETNRVLAVLATPWRGVMPLPELRFHFWNTNFLDRFAYGDLAQVVLGLVLIGVVATLFMRCRPLLLGYLVGTAGLIAFALLVYVGHLRHHGHHLLLLVACLWMWRNTAGFAGVPRLRGLLLAALLVVNAVAGVYATVRDWRDPFSAGREVARYIRSEGPSGVPIVGHRDVLVETVTGYLKRPVYYPSIGREATFIPWAVTKQQGVDDAEALRQARLLARERGGEVLVVFSWSGSKRPPTLDGAIKIAGFYESIVRSERFELFSVSPPGY